MRATRVALQSSLGGRGRKLLLLPDPTFMEKLGAVFQGGWSVIFDRDSRAAYEEAVKAKVIKDVVLHQSNIGSLLTYQLFSNLHLLG